MLRILSWDTWKEPSRIQGPWLNLQQSLVPIVSLICLVLRIPTIRPNQKLIFSGNYQISIEPKYKKYKHFLSQRCSKNWFDTKPNQ